MDEQSSEELSHYLNHDSKWLEGDATELKNFCNCCCVVKRLCIGCCVFMTTLTSFILIILYAPAGGGSFFGADFAPLTEALPQDVDLLPILPLFDFKDDGCLPAAAISADGIQNPGVEIGGRIAEGCRFDDFLDASNTMHRFSCVSVATTEFCGHVYGIYTEKDQVAWGFGGHVNDWEHALVWTINGTVSHGSFSAHGDFFTKPVSELATVGQRIKFSYYKDQPFTHALKFAGERESAQNPYGIFVIPPVASWFEMTGNGLSNAELRDLLEDFDYGSASLRTRDSRFLDTLNENSPDGFPTF